MNKLWTLLQNNISYFYISIVILFPNILRIISEWYYVRNSNQLLLLFNDFYTAINCAVLLLIAILVFFVFFKKRFFIYITVGVIYLVTAYFTLNICFHIEKQYRWGKGEIATPVIVAIDKYINNENKIPDNLNELVPEYISQKELTSIIATLELKLNVKDERYSNSWTLEIPLREREGKIINSMLIYYPKKNYPFKEDEKNGWAIVYYKW